MTIRTLDTGGDKKLPFFTITETNPFLGRRGIRLTLDHTEIFLIQLRALLGANAGCGNLHSAVVHGVCDIVQRAHRWRQPVGACDEMAGDPASALLPVGLGADSLGMTPSSRPSVKRTIRSVTLRQARGLADKALKFDNEADTHRLLNHTLKAAGLSVLVHGN